MAFPLRHAFPPRHGLSPTSWHGLTGPSGAAHRSNERRFPQFIVPTLATGYRSGWPARRRAMTRRGPRDGSIVRAVGMAPKIAFAGLPMGIGLWLHLAARHDHEHETLEHEHNPAHDEHRRHPHDGQVTAPHSHRHRHEKPHHARAPSRPPSPSSPRVEVPIQCDIDGGMNEIPDALAHRSRFTDAGTAATACDRVVAPADRGIGRYRLSSVRDRRRAEHDMYQTADPTTAG